MFSTHFQDDVQLHLYHNVIKTVIIGLFSFFAVPLLLGDITLDFMNMIDVMVDVMVMATGAEGEEGAGGNNNNNNNGEAAAGTDISY